MSAPTPVSALVHSSTLVTAGLIIFLKFDDISLNRFIGESLLYLRGITIFIRSVIAIIEKDLKKLVALSTLRQISFISFTISINLITIAMLHLFVHAFLKRILFFCIGSTIHSNIKKQDFRKIKDGINISNTVLFSMLVSLVRIRGLIFLSGFVRKEIIVQTTFCNNVNKVFLL